MIDRHHAKVDMPNRQARYQTDRPLRRDAARNRLLLIQAAREVFALRGIDASMDDIAAHAGLGVGTAYRHFANKYELANAIFDRAVDRLVNSAEGVGQHQDPWDALVLTVESVLAAQADNRALREIVLGVHPDDRERRDMLLAPLRRCFERAAAAGRVRADAEFADVVMILVMACALTEWVGAVAPQLWRRYLPPMLTALGERGGASPIAALTDAELVEVTARRAATAAG